MLRLVQLQHPREGRRIAFVEEPKLVLLRDACTTYDWAFTKSITIDRDLDYEPIYRGESDWRLLVPFDHPKKPARCLVSGTGLTHVASARQRDAMHGRDLHITDSLRMFNWGVEGGKPAEGKIGVAPEWFYKGDGDILRAHGQPLDSPAYADDAGEEPELVGCYIIAPDGTPCRVGFTTGNEFSDHVHERKNYLYLMESKLRPAAIGPELLVGEAPSDIRGRVAIERGGKEIWSAALATGEDNMCHAIVNLEHHHFKHLAHRRPGDAHVHFFGADTFSYSAGVTLHDGDVMIVEWHGLGRPLRNQLRQAPASEYRMTRIRHL